MKKSSKAIVGFLMSVTTFGGVFYQQKLNTNISDVESNDVEINTTESSDEVSFSSGISDFKIDQKVFTFIDRDGTIKYGTKNDFSDISSFSSNEGKFSSIFLNDTISIGKSGSLKNNSFFAIDDSSNNSLYVFKENSDSTFEKIVLSLPSEYSKNDIEEISVIDGSTISILFTNEVGGKIVFFDLTSTTITINQSLTNVFNDFLSSNGFDKNNIKKYYFIQNDYNDDGTLGFNDPADNETTFIFEDASDNRLVFGKSLFLNNGFVSNYFEGGRINLFGENYLYKLNEINYIYDSLEDKFYLVLQLDNFVNETVANEDVNDTDQVYAIEYNSNLSFEEYSLYDGSQKKDYLNMYSFKWYSIDEINYMYFDYIDGTNNGVFFINFENEVDENNKNSIYRLLKLHDDNQGFLDGVKFEYRELFIDTVDESLIMNYIEDDFNEKIGLSSVYMWGSSMLTIRDDGTIFGYSLKTEEFLSSNSSFKSENFNDAIQLNSTITSSDWDTKIINDLEIIEEDENNKDLYTSGNTIVIATEEYLFDSSIDMDSFTINNGETINNDVYDLTFEVFNNGKYYFSVNGLEYETGYTFTRLNFLINSISTSVDITNSFAMYTDYENISFKTVETNLTNNNEIEFEFLIADEDLSLFYEYEEKFTEENITFEINSYNSSNEQKIFSSKELSTSENYLSYKINETSDGVILKTNAIEEGKLYSNFELTIKVDGTRDNEQYFYNSDSLFTINPNVKNEYILVDNGIKLWVVFVSVLLLIIFLMIILIFISRSFNKKNAQLQYELENLLNNGIDSEMFEDDEEE